MVKYLARRMFWLLMAAITVIVAALPSIAPMNPSTAAMYYQGTMIMIALMAGAAALEQIDKKHKILPLSKTFAEWYIGMFPSGR
jgi:hypothetical protein